MAPPSVSTFDILTSMKKRAPKPPAKLSIPLDIFTPPSKHVISSPFTLEELRRTEKALGVKLPKAYIQLLKHRNGGYLYRDHFRPLEKPPRDYGPASMYDVPSIAGIDAEHWSSLTNKFETARTEWQLPDGLVPFSGDGHEWVCLDYRTCGPRGNPSIAHILVAEDQADIRDLLVLNLQGAGYAVQAVADGVAALASQQERASDLLILHQRAVQSSSRPTQYFRQDLQRHRVFGLSAIVGGGDMTTAPRHLPDTIAGGFDAGR
jgi:hypothetical protein